jgi:hypothetical protein
LAWLVASFVIIAGHMLETGNGPSSSFNPQRTLQTPVLYSETIAFTLAAAVRSRSYIQVASARYFASYQFAYQFPHISRHDTTSMYVLALQAQDYRQCRGLTTMLPDAIDAET